MQTTNRHALTKSFPGKGFISIIAALTLWAQPGNATQCSQWDVAHYGNWQLDLSNSVVVTVNLRQNGKSFTGTGHYVVGAGSHSTQSLDFQVTGTIDGDNFYAETAGGEIVVYTGKVNSQGIIEGSCYAKSNPNKVLTWYSHERMECARSNKAQSIIDSAIRGTTANVDQAGSPRGVVSGRHLPNAPTHGVASSQTTTRPAASATGATSQQQGDRAVVLEEVTFPDKEGNRAHLEVNKIYPIRRITDGGALIKVFDRVTGKEVGLLQYQARLLKPGEKFKPPPQATSSSSTETTESASTETPHQKKKHKKKHHHHHDEDEN